MYEYKCEVERVIDGDTVVLNVDLGFGLSKEVHTRLLNVYAPKANTPEGKEATEKLIELLNNEEAGPARFGDLRVKFIKRRSFYRYIGTIYYGDDNINEEMNDWFMKEEQETHTGFDTL